MLCFWHRTQQNEEIESNAWNSNGTKNDRKGHPYGKRYMQQYPINWIQQSIEAIITLQRCMQHSSAIRVQPNQMKKKQLKQICYSSNGTIGFFFFFCFHFFSYFIIDWNRTVATKAQRKITERIKMRAKSIWERDRLAKWNEMKCIKH